MNRPSSSDLARRAASTLGRAVAFAGPRMSHPLTGVLLVAMIVVGVVLRVQNVGYPFHLGFDEHQYVGAAHQFLIGVKDTAECCHPPLSKFLIGTGMVLCGNHPMGWRFMPLVFGLQAMVLAFLIAQSLFADRKAAWLAAAFMAADGFYLSYSRAALPDMILACLVLWAMLAAVSARGWAGVVTCAVLVGAAASVKWVGLLVGLPAVFAIVVLRRVSIFTLASFALVPLVHLAVWMIGLKLLGQANDPLSVWNEIRARQNIHLGFAHHTNPLESAWYTWLFLYHPIVIKSAVVAGTVRIASSVGNPLLWLGGDLCLLGLPVAGAVIAARPGWRKTWLTWFDRPTTTALAILWVAWLSMMLLWMSGRIVTYYYHYLTPWGFAIVLLAGVVSRFERRFPLSVLVFVSLVFAVAIYFAPVWAELPLSLSSVHSRLVFPLWR